MKSYSCGVFMKAIFSPLCPSSAGLARSISFIYAFQPLKTHRLSALHLSKIGLAQANSAPNACERLMHSNAVALCNQPAGALAAGIITVIPGLLRLVAFGRLRLSM